MKCPICGNEVDTNLTFCGECGTDISEFKTIAPNVSTSGEGVDVHQEETDRLFLDDDEPELLEDNVIDNFLNNLETLSENDDMELNKDYVAKSELKISPVLEEIPEEVVEEKVTETEDNRDSIDNYLDIVIGDERPATYVPPNVDEVLLSSILEKDIAGSENSVTESPNNKVSETIEDEPHIFIDNRRETEQIEINSNDIPVDLSEANQTPYLDSFVPKRNIDVDFETTSTPELEDISSSSFSPPITPAHISQAEIAQQLNAPIMQNPKIQSPSETPTQTIPYSSMPVQNPVPISQTTINNTTSVSNVNIKGKKKGNAGVIIAIICGVLLLSTIIGCIFLSRDKLSDFFNKEETTITETTTNNSENTETPQIDHKPSTQNPNWIIKNNSNIETPLYIGDSSIATRYLDDTKTYEDLEITLTKVYRGDEAKNIANEYESSANIEFKETNSDTEYVVIEYQVYIPEKIATQKTIANLPVSIRGSSNTGVQHNGKSYLISTWCIENGGLISAGQLTTCREIFQIPVDCTDYFIIFGAEGQNLAFYKGE